MARPSDEQIEHEELSDAVRETELEILEEAFAKSQPQGGEAPAQQQTQAEPGSEPAADTGERLRDDKGRFVPREGQQQAPQQQQPAAEGTQAAAGEGEGEQRTDDGGEQVPRWRLREMAEERRAAIAERDQIRAELIRMQTLAARQSQPGQPQGQQQKQEDIDPLLDPQGFANKMRAEFSQQLHLERLNFSLARAHDKHGEVFEKAYEAVILQGQQGNRQLVDALTRAPDPGGAIVGWYRQQELMRESGGDLGKYKQKVRDELLKDPEFIRAAIGVAREMAANGGALPQQQGQPGRPNNITRLPPSLSRATGSNTNEPVDTDDSDRAVFDYAFR